MKLLLLFSVLIAVLCTASSYAKEIEGYYPLEVGCSNTTVCPTNSFCDLSQGLCVCNYGWATKDDTTCPYKLRCQQTLILANGLYGTGYFYLGLNGLGTAMAVLSYIIIGLPVTVFWLPIAGILFAQNHYVDDNGFYPLISNCA